MRARSRRTGTAPVSPSATIGHTQDPFRVAVLGPVVRASTPRCVRATAYANALDRCVESCLARDEAATARCQAGTCSPATPTPADGLAICHAVGRVLGTYGVVRQDASVPILSHGMRYDEPVCAERHAGLRGAWTEGSLAATASLSPAAAAAAAAAAACLGELTLDRSDLASIAHGAFLDRHMQAIPRPFGSELDLERFLGSAW